LGAKISIYGNKVINIKLVIQITKRVKVQHIRILNDNIDIDEKSDNERKIIRKS
jgi:hypothetical protein